MSTNQRVAQLDDDAIVSVLTRLARPHSSGGQVVERAALMASGADLAGIEAWILAHQGEPEHTSAPAPKRGLHGHRVEIGRRDDVPARFVLPPGVLNRGKPDAG